MTQYRASFDASITFLNGGGLHTEGFRLDVPGPDVTVGDVSALLIRHLGLLMVDQVTLTGLEVFPEAHKGSRGGPSDPDARRSAGTGRRELIELNHIISDGMTTYPGLPAPKISRHLSRERSREHYATGTEFSIDRIEMVGNTGTYLDSPFHRYGDGVDLAGLELPKVADLPITLVDLTGGQSRSITAEAMAPYEIAGRAVLLRTGWDRHWGTEAYLGGGGDAPYLCEDGAEWLVAAGAVLVGIDGVNIDDTTGKDRPAHSVLLAAGIPVLEHLTALGELAGKRARLHAAPPRLREFGTFPVRAYAVVED